jgi:hypothetical protein
MWLVNRRPQTHGEISDGGSGVELQAHSSRDREKGNILFNRTQRNTRAMFQRMAESMNLDLLKHILPFNSHREPSFGPIVANGLGDRYRFDSREKILGPLGPSQKNVSKV